MRIISIILFLLGFSLSALSQTLTADFGRCRILISDKRQTKISDKESIQSEVVVKSSSGRFSLHYFTSGADALPNIDNNLNSINDYIDTALVEIEHVFQIEVIEAGLTTTLLDDVHIYFKNLGSGLYGQTVDDSEGFIGDNPFRSKSYMEINSNVNNFDVKPMDMIRVTLAHEFQHVLHMKYGLWIGNESDPVFLPFYEMAATFFEETIYDSVNDYYLYLRKGPFDYPNSPPFYRSFSFSDPIFMYGSAIFFIYMQDLFGVNETRSLMTEINKNLTTTTPWVNLTTEFDKKYNSGKFNLTLNQYFNRYALGLANTGDNPAANQFFSEGASYPKFDAFSKNRNTIDILPNNTIYITPKIYRAGYADYWLRYNSTSYPLIISNANFEYYYTEGMEVISDSLRIQIQSFNDSESREIPFEIKTINYSPSQNIVVSLFNPEDLTTHQESNLKEYFAFPNPLNLGRHDYLGVRLPISNKPYTISIFDINGKPYFSSTVPPSTINYNYPIAVRQLMNEMGSGVYFVRVEYSGGTLLSKILVIR